MAIVGPVLPASLSEVAVAVLLGAVVANLLPVGDRVQPGAKTAVDVILTVGVVLLGARLAVGKVLAEGLAALASLPAVRTWCSRSGRISPVANPGLDSDCWSPPGR